MAMSQATLAAALVYEPKATEALAIVALAAAYREFAAEAVALTPILEGGLDAGEEAMIADLAGMSADGAGPTKLAAGVLAFWGAVAAGLATSFLNATAITAPPHAGLVAALAAAGAANIAGALSAEDSADAIAAVLYTGATTGGTVTTPTSVVTPIT